MRTKPALDTEPLEANLPILEEVSTVTAKGRTIVPEAVSHALGIKDGGRIAFRVEGGQVTLHSVEDQHADSIVGRFLDFLSTEIERHPGSVKALSRRFATRLNSIGRGKKVDTHAPIAGPVDL